MPGIHSLELARSYSSSNDSEDPTYYNAWHSHLFSEVSFKFYRNERGGVDEYATLRDGGSQMVYHALGNGSKMKILKDSLEYGITNTASRLSGRTHCKNTTIEAKGEEDDIERVTRGDGTKQRYHLQDDPYRDVFFLESEDKPSGVSRFPINIILVLYIRWILLRRKIGMAIS